jgi:TonB family protein
MKRCGACGEEFQNQSNFCPVDGEALFRYHDTVAFEYRPTIISGGSLVPRLAEQLSFLIARLRVAWTQFKANPEAFLDSQTRQVLDLFRKRSARPYLRKALAASVTVVLLVIMGVMILDGHRTRPAQPDGDDFGETTLINPDVLTATDSKKSGSGVGANDQGRVGFNKGKGEGSGPTPARAQGGGSGGDRSLLPPSLGRVPQPSEIPAPIPTTYARALPQTLPDAGVNIDPVLWKNLPYPNYGDPRSKSTTPSNGPGEGGGVGTNKGTGIGDGSGPGVGPGNDGNTGGDQNRRGCCGSSGADGNKPNNDDADRVFKQPEVTTRARVLAKPEPQYTEEARKTGVTGTVVLSVVFSRTGQVTNIRAVQTLCCGLTEKAIAAARSIRFIPAMRNGQVVSTYMQLEYNFNLY